MTSKKRVEKLINQAESDYRKEEDYIKRRLHLFISVAVLILLAILCISFLDATT